MEPFKPPDMTTLSRQQVETNFQAFIEALTQISRQYGIAVYASNALIVPHDPHICANLHYIADMNSGDIYPE